MSVIVTAAVAPLLVEGSVRAEQVSQLVLGETGSVIGRQADWYQVRAHRDGYEGWVHRGYIAAVSPEVAARWRDAAGGWSDGAAVAAHDHAIRLPLGARLALENGGVRLPDGRLGTITTGAVRPQTDVVAEARRSPPERWALARFEGTPYQWGGITPWGVDCSGLVQTTFAVRGLALPRDSSQQVSAGEAVPLDQFRPGDLLFFHGESGGLAITHVAFYADGDTIVHATLACGGVLVESFASGSRAGPLRARLVAARRIESR